MPILVYIIIFSLVGGIFSIIGGVLLLGIKKEEHDEIFIHFLSFAAGALLAAAFFDLFPESIESGLDVNRVFAWAFGGFLVSFLLEGVFLRFHHHDTERLQTTPWMMLASDSAHNFLDGVAITAAFLVSIPLGIVTALAVAAHEIPQEIGDFSIMLHAGWKRAKVLWWNIGSALMTTVGALVAFQYRGFVEPIIGYILALTAGVFIYIAASDIVPELYHGSRRDKLSHVMTLFLAGVVVVWLAIRFAHSFV
jgi:zinc and cadmium transporter